MMQNAMSDVRRMQAAMARAGILQENAETDPEDSWMDVPMTPVAAEEAFLSSHANVNQSTAEAEGNFPDTGS